MAMAFDAVSRTAAAAAAFSDAAVDERIGADGRAQLIASSSAIGAALPRCEANVAPQDRKRMRPANRYRRPHFGEKDLAPKGALCYRQRRHQRFHHSYRRHRYRHRHSVGHRCLYPETTTPSLSAVCCVVSLSVPLPLVLWTCRSGPPPVVVCASVGLAKIIVKRTIERKLFMSSNTPLDSYGSVQDNEGYGT